jgi:hypothetical protein
LTTKELMNLKTLKIVLLLLSIILPTKFVYAPDDSLFNYLTTEQIKQIKRLRLFDNTTSIEDILVAPRKPGEVGPCPSFKSDGKTISLNHNRFQVLIRDQFGDIDMQRWTVADTLELLEKNGVDLIDTVKFRDTDPRKLRMWNGKAVTPPDQPFVTRPSSLPSVNRYEGPPVIQSRNFSLPDAPPQPDRPPSPFDRHVGFIKPRMLTLDPLTLLDFELTRQELQGVRQATEEKEFIASLTAPVTEPLGIALNTVYERAKCRGKQIPTNRDGILQHVSIWSDYFLSSSMEFAGDFASRAKRTAQRLYNSSYYGPGGPPMSPGYSPL